MSGEIGKEIIQQLYQSNIIKTWPKDNEDGWFLCNEMWSPYYFNLREILSKKNGRHIMNLMGQGMVDMLTKETNVNRVIGVATAGIPFSTMITSLSGIPSCYTAKVTNGVTLDSVRTAPIDEIITCKRYGEPNLVEGEMVDQDAVCLVDDIITDGSSKVFAKALVMREAKRRMMSISCTDAVVVVDREQGGCDRLKSDGMRLHSLVPLKTKGIEWLYGVMTDKEIDVMSDYLEHPENYQIAEIRADIRESL